MPVRVAENWLNACSGCEICILNKKYFRPYRMG
jgi:coenzyme F420-reducing hydrogenase gamma subunit